MEFNTEMCCDHVKVRLSIDGDYVSVLIFLYHFHEQYSQKEFKTSIFSFQNLNALKSFLKSPPSIFSYKACLSSLRNSFSDVYDHLFSLLLLIIQYQLVYSLPFMIIKIYENNVRRLRLNGHKYEEVSYNSSTNRVVLVFTSDPSSSRKGFRATYKGQ